MTELDDFNIKNLNLSKRIYHTLIRNGIFTIGDLKNIYVNNKLHRIRMFGEKSLDEISKALEEFHKNPLVSENAEKNHSSLINLEVKQIEIKNESSLDVLNLQPAIKGMLKRHGIETIDSLRRTPDSVLLNINLIGPKKLRQIRSHLANFTGETDIPIINEPLKIVERKNITWSQVIEGFFSNENDIRIYILISRFGYRTKKLEELATELGITRERIRQIQELVIKRYLKHIRIANMFEMINKIDEVFLIHGDRLSLESFKTILVREGFLGQFSKTITTEYIKNLDLFETLVCWLKLLSDKRYTSQPIEFSVNISNLLQSGNVSIRDNSNLMNISTKERKEIKRKIFFTGGITIKEATKILSQDERVTILAFQNLNLQRIDNEWFSLKNISEDKENKKIPLRVAGLKMLAVNPFIDVNSFHDGLRKHASRFYTSIAPLNVIKHILPLLGFEIYDSKISTKLSTIGVLSRSEVNLISAVRKNEGVASFLEIAEEFFLQNLSLPAVSITLRRSPIAEKVEEGLYKLRGTEIPWQNIEIAQKRQKRFAQDDEITHGLDGIVRMKFTVNGYAFLTGVVGAWNIKELSGSWEVIDNKDSLGDAKIDQNYLWGLAKAFKKMEMKIGERVELAFNTWNRTLSVRKVQDENS